TLRDELPVVVKTGPIAAIGKQAMLFEEFLAGESRRGTLSLPFRRNGARKAYLHGHCHQKALGTMPDVVAALELVPGLSVEVIDSSCCGMAGAFGYEAEHYEVSMRMAERSLLPAVRAAPPGDEVIPIANRLQERFDLVVATQDWHPPRHGSFASSYPAKKPGELVELAGLPQVLWPDHCVQGTAGADFAETLEMDRVEAIFRKGTDPRIDSYSGFFEIGRASCREKGRCRWTQDR